MQPALPPGPVPAVRGEDYAGGCSKPYGPLLLVFRTAALPAASTSILLIRTWNECYLLLRSCLRK